MQRVADKDFIWMDVVSFTVEVVVNYQNDSICTTSLRKIHECVRTDFRRQKSIGVRAAVASDSLKSLLVFLVKRNRIYQQMLEREVLPWLPTTLWNTLCLHSRWNCSTHDQFGAELVQESITWILTNQFFLHQTLTIILWTLRYDPFLRVVFHVSRTRGEAFMTSWYNLNEGIMNVNWKGIKCFAEGKRWSFLFVHLCKLFSINIAINLKCSLTNT